NDRPLGSLNVAQNISPHHASRCLGLMRFRTSWFEGLDFFSQEATLKHVPRKRAIISSLRLASRPFIYPNAVPVMRGMSGPGVGGRARRRRREPERADDADRRAQRADCLRPAQTYPAAQERVKDEHHHNHEIAQK